MKRKKFREIRNALVMVIVMVAMMSSATFAWFTMTNSPTVTGLQMTAASSAGLLVSNAQGTGFTNAIVAANDNGILDTEQEPLTLTPVTPKLDGSGKVGFAQAKYDNGTVIGLDDALTGDDIKGKVAVYTYWLKAESEEVGVGIVAGNSTSNSTTVLSVANGVASLPGTFVRQKEGGQATDEGAENAIRIGLVVGNNDSGVDSLYILEPNCNGANITDESARVSAPIQSGATVKNDGFVTKVKFSKEGKIYSGDLQTEATQSDALFNVGTTATKVTMYIWLEGNDDQCIDQIKADEIEGQIQFVALEKITTNP